MKWIRPIISLIAVIGITIGFFLDKITAETYVGIMAIAIIYWYKSRDDEKRNNFK